MIRTTYRLFSLAARVVLFALICLLLGCSDPSLQKAAHAIEGVAITNDALTKTVIAENAAGVISDNDTRVILNQICSKVSEAVILTSDLTLSYSKFPADAKPKLAPLLQPILDAIKGALDSGLAGIKNSQTMANIKTALLSIQAGLIVAQSALGGA
jgi:hypothetical protein